MENVKTIINSKDNWKIFNFDDLWHYRELFFFLVWRDIKVRYKQTVLGAAWAVLQPVLTMIVFSVIFGRLAGLPSEGIPYPIFTFAALLPWQLFSFALTNSSNSLVNEKNLITKVYFPRIIIPFSSVVAGLLDFLIVLGIYLILMLVYQIPLTWRVFVDPHFCLIAIITAVSVGLWLTTLNVKYRDVRYVIPFLTQVLDVCHPNCLLLLVGSGKMDVAVQPESDGGRGGWIPLDADWAMQCNFRLSFSCLGRGCASCYW